MTDDCECPTCGKGEFDTEKAMKLHHVMAHDESIAGAEVECAHCGSEKRIDLDAARRADRYFCDNECKGEWQSENITGEDHHQYTRVECRCDHCGDGFEVKPYAKRERRFCSQECRNQAFKERMSGEGNPMWEGGKEQVQCKQCGGSYRVDTCDVENTSFCSKACQSTYWSENWSGEDHPNWKGGTETLECEHCGDDFEALSGLASKRRFCSKSCFRDGYEYPTGQEHPLWGGGDKKYGAGWNAKKRREVRIRDQARCQHCGRTEPNHIEEYGTKHSVHHITPARQIDDPKERNAMENLITLCAGECHHTWEQIAPLRPDTANAAAD